MTSSSLIMIVVASSVGLGEVAVQGQHSEQGERVLADLAAVGHAWLTLNWRDGTRPIPVSLPVPIASPARACTRWPPSPHPHNHVPAGWSHRPGLRTSPDRHGHPVQPSGHPARSSSGHRPAKPKHSRSWNLDRLAARPRPDLRAFRTLRSLFSADGLSVTNNSGAPGSACPRWAPCHQGCRFPPVYIDGVTNAVNRQGYDNVLRTTALVGGGCRANHVYGTAG